ncbi:hypothetical protein MMU07_03400 [Aquiflexum sp. LQ15W]|uniref:hypothetical protein n=1 Tax=Cognataquiflexum nitidum TaxID=2922272 RepID=UPI001F1317FF|nr:hypothetical protein [Cognataquiflexum nitidum]MCH6198611.1 hypothetical protein [Cognataquiflexum nitidum]
MDKTTAFRLPRYTLDKDWDGTGRFYILNDNCLLMLRSDGDPFPPYPKEAAEILLEDINEILSQKVFINEGEKQRALTPKEVSRHVKFRIIRQEQQLMSFCVRLEEMIANPEPETEKIADLKLEERIQWDLLYRMSPDPHVKMDQLQACYEAIHWLGADWKDLMANYASDMEEMREMDIPFVAASLTQRLQQEVDSMTLPEKLAVAFLYGFFHGFSITIPILWVRGKISVDAFEDACNSLLMEFSQEELIKMKNEGGDFVSKRLAFLKRFLEEKAHTEDSPTGIVPDFDPSHD